jgi:DNA modification methylase
MKPFEFKQIDINEIKPSPIRELRLFVVRQLEKSILENGYNPARPLTVFNEHNSTYLLVDGHHRYEAIKNIKDVKKVPCIVLNDGDLIQTAIQNNEEQDVYAKFDLFDWLGIVKELKNEGKKGVEIAKEVNKSSARVSQFTQLLENVSEESLTLCENHQEGRSDVGINSVNFSFTEGWFRDSGIYTLREFPQRQKQFLDTFFIWTSEQRTRKENAQREIAKLKRWEDEIAFTKENLLDKESLEALIRDIEHDYYQDINLLRTKVRMINQEWQEKNKIRILPGDCFEQNIEPYFADLILTDIPYNYSRENRYFAMERTGIDFGEWDHIDNYPEFLNKVASLFFKALKPSGSFYVFVGAPSVSYLWDALEKAGLMPKRVMVWNKTNAIPINKEKLFIASAEFFIWGTKGESWTFNVPKEKIDGKTKPELLTTVLDMGTDPNGRLHPNQKPEKLIEKLLDISSNIDDQVFDPFSGSGTVAVVSKRRKRRCLAIEKDPRYYEKSILRLNSVKNDI